MSNKEFFLIKKSNDYYLYDESKSWAIGSSNDRQRTPNGYKLSVENCNEIFGVVDIKKLADVDFTSEIGEGPTTNTDINSMVRKSHLNGAEFGFNKAMDLNKDKLFTVEDMMNMYILGGKYKVQQPISFLEKGNEIIESLQDKIIEVEIEMKSNLHIGEIVDESYPKDFPTSIPKLDENGCVTLIKKK
jgi:hypothetical protein